MEFIQTIYINGLERRATQLATYFYVDDPKLPRRKCSYHQLKPESILWLQAGNAVYTGGNLYNLRPNPH